MLNVAMSWKVSNDVSAPEAAIHSRSSSGSPPCTGVWENVLHHPSQAGGGLSDVDYGTIVDSIGNSV